MQQKLGLKEKKMCGIGTIFATKGREISEAHHDALKKMTEALHLRGPDAQGSFYDKQIGLVHTRLSILDPHPRSTQPMESEDWVLSYNGEIYNYKNIRSELQKKYNFQTNSDSEALLLALQEWGLDITLEKCAGMFAFLAYNKTEKLLYGVRDRMGIKPLFIARPEDGIFFLASSPAAICKAIPEKKWQPYNPALASYFTLGAPFTTMSAIEGIERIEPAHYVKICSNGLLTKHQYWKPEYQENFTFEDLIEIVREHQVSDVKSALFLSGGVDSTFLASITNELDFFHLKSPEANYARKVAKKYQRPYVEVTPALDDYEKGIEKVCFIHGEPYMSCGIPYILSREVAASGYKMALSANGADELFFGYPRTPIPGDMTTLPQHEEASYTWFHQQLSHIFRDGRNFSIPALAEYMPSLMDIGFYALEKFHLPNFPVSANY
ncbi:MAG TPA: asparagine synthase-related protein, partial [Gammaproteobacteria bacterium]|nr:asparagine synthase-related protein [Gammaproteobacteria bacterium]